MTGRSEDDDAVVARLVALADEEDGVERIGAASLAAYRSLARARGVPVEHVVRAALRGELRSVVAPDSTNGTPDTTGAAAITNLLGDVHPVDGPDSAA